jgi:hypothetical protein
MDIKERMMAIVFLLKRRLVGVMTMEGFSTGSANSHQILLPTNYNGT